ncbi:type I polyketide synthase [candidate division KSB3 bacterium]|uniref:Type I polyketide synthase n=1 Tax=candidate division KSB3 bacterium TaxID=2044937 RepID=A0A2G6E0X5_9BACT|nr:MAG: type I polyketide synthase [candidate division KSB3 bacterium]PIE28408.1 MAG: type I polyketide synthase [candidate division KSB3 bacterium]
MNIEHPIAIVGIGGIFPGASTLKEFWRNIENAVSSARDVPPGRWPLTLEDAFDPERGRFDKVYSTRGCYVEDFRLDPEGLDLDPDLLNALDPVFHFALHAARDALKDANAGECDRERTGVILGNIALPTEKMSALTADFLGRSFEEHLLGTVPASDFFPTHPLNRHAVGLVAGLICKAFHFGAGSYTVDGACAASLYAVNYAVEALLSGRADLMMSGGVCRPDSAFTQMGFCQLGALSPSGKCAPFDAENDGLVVGEGAGIFILKRLEDAVRDSNRIYALIRGIGFSNDRRGSLLAPDSEGQVRAMRMAYESAGWQPQDVDLIECHATGTPVGDLVEFESLKKLWGADSQQPGQCVIGGVKSNVGHLLTGAGAAGMMKTILALKYQILPPTANFSTPNPKFDLEKSPFTVLTHARHWEKRAEHTPRRAAVSAFGFGGINAHVLLEEWEGGSSKTQTLPVDLRWKASANAELPIAIVGMDVHFGPWDSLRAFQERLFGRSAAPDSATRRRDWGISDSRWFQKSMFKDSALRGYFIDELVIPGGRFKIPPKELQESLPQQVLMLLTAAGAVEDAQLNLEDEAALRTGVFIGIGLDAGSSNFSYRWSILPKVEYWAKELGLYLNKAELAEWAQELRDSFCPPLTANRTVGALGGIVAGRVAREFNAGGAGISISSEENSGLQALNAALRSLQQGDLDQAIVGAVDLAGDIRMLLSGQLETTYPLLSKGVLPGEGSAAIIVKRLDDALKDGDKIYAVIKEIGTVSSNTGDLEDCERIEGAQAEIGYTGAASGLASLVKHALCVYREILPDGDPQYWLRNRADGPRRSELRSFSVDGACLRVVLEGYDVQEEQTARSIGTFTALEESLFMLEGEQSRDLEQQAAELQDVVESQSTAQIETLARKWWRRNPAPSKKALGLSLLARSVSELKEHITRVPDILRNGVAPDFPGQRIFFNAHPLGKHGEMAFVFPGSGNHYPRMGRKISAHWPEILRRQDQDNHYLKGQYIPDMLWNCPDRETLHRHPREILLGQVAYSTMMADLLRSFGLWPQAAIGYSLGESSALFAMKAWTSRDEMLQRVLESSLYTHDLAGRYEAAAKHWGFPQGQAADWVVAAVHLPADEIRPRLEGRKHVYLLIINAPASCVIGGERRDVMELEEILGAHFQVIGGVTAAHCEILNEVKQSYRDLHYFENTVVPQGLRFYSGAWKKSYELSADSAADAILAQAMTTIDFPAVIRQAYQDGVRSFIEVGPGTSCTNMINKILAEQPHFAASACASSYEDPSTVLRLLGRAHAERIPSDLSALYAQEREALALQPQKIVKKNALRMSVGGKPFHVNLPPEKTTFAQDCAASKDTMKAGNRTDAVQAVSGPAVMKPVLKSLSSVGQAATENASARTVQYTPQSGQIGELIQGLTEIQHEKLQAHQEYCQFAQALSQNYSDQLAFHMSLLELLQESGQLPAALSVEKTEPLSSRAAAEKDFRSLQPSHEKKGRSEKLRQALFMTRAQCMEFAIGSIGAVLGARFAEIDAHPTRVRLPDDPLMLVDRILAVEGEPCSMRNGRVITEHDVSVDSWYLDCGRIPTCIAVESGQADLFLSAYLGIDFITKGLAVYRLLDATVTFYDDLPQAGDSIRHDIHIDEFFRQGDMHLFRFRFESRVKGKVFLRMSSGCAGFFTQQDLDDGKGLVFTKMDRLPMPGKVSDDWQVLTPISGTESYSDTQLEALRRGELAECFGPRFANLPLQHPCRLPGGRMKLVDRIVRLDPQGGRYGLGMICGEADIHPDDWFLRCHFVDDQVMPGTLMYECCLHTLRVLLMRMGWLGEQDEIAWQPVPAVAGQLKCRGQVVASTKTVRYDIAIKEIGYRPEPYVICDAVMSADGKAIVRMIDMSLRLSGMTKERLEAIWRAGPEITSSYLRKPAIFGPETIRAFSNGKPSEAFGERYRVFDSERRIARLPGPPYQFLDRITALEGEQWVMTAPKMAEAQYDVPADAWYFAANSHQGMPFAIVLEIVLQPCGWLAAYAGSALSSAIDLSFRNLGGTAIQFALIPPEIGTLTTLVRLTNVSRSAGMIVQHYHYTLTNSSGSVLYQGTTYFGFFSRQALMHQVGLRDAKPYHPGKEESAKGERCMYPQDMPFPATQMRMVDSIDLYLADGGPHGLGFIRGTKQVDPNEWFFKAHFYQDPVWPGSLGLEALIQLLKVVALKRWGWRPEYRFESMGLNAPHEWIYRGQVIPTDREVTIQAVITSVDETQRLLEAEGFLIVDGRVIYQMKNFSLKVNGKRTLTGLM